MSKFIFIFLCLFIGCSNIAFAQNNEGFIKLKHLDQNNKITFITWYFKADKLACTVESFTTQNEKIITEIAFDRSAQKIYLNYPASNYSTNIETKLITAKPDISNGLTVTELGRGNIEPTFKQNVDIKINSQLTETITEYTTDVAFDWVLYSDFIKDDYSIAAMINNKIKGLPYKSVTKDKEGKIISQYELVSYKLQKLDNKLFR